MPGYQPINYREQGGKKWVIGSGGEIDIESGGALKIAGTDATTRLASLTALSTAELEVLDGASSVSAIASKAVIADANKKINLGLVGAGAAASASGLLFGVGTTAAPALTAAAGANFVEIRAKTTATSGDNRLQYYRYEIAGATGGECIRAFSKVANAGCTTVRGAHISIDFADAGAVSGFGAGVDAQCLLPNASLASTVTALNAEIYSAGASSAVTGQASFIRCVNGGNATGMADIDDNGYLMSLQGLSVASGHLFQVNTAAAATHALKILIGSTPYYIMLTDTGA